jgi:hypothetical protein
MARNFVKLNTQDRIISQLQDNIDQAFNVTNVFNDGILHQGIALASGATTLNHGLGRPLIGWVITRKSGAADVYDTQATNLLPERNLTLVASAAITVDILVF